MCGICGIVDFGGGGVEERAVARAMTDVLAHRGPDGEGLWGSPSGVLLGHRRLAIIDLAGGQQPMAGCGGRVHVTFNGEIYNFRELQRELEARGHRFHTHSDTETIVHAYEEFGARAVERLRGMFAFAVWDEPRRELLLARDRVGKKPLYYALTARGALVFGSELKSLLEHPDVAREIDPEALDAYLTFGYVPDPLTIFRGVCKLPPGCHLTLREGAKPRIERYWDFPYERVEGGRSAGDKGRARAEDYLEELRALLDEAVRIRLVSDVPLGAFLSGGIDSSTVVGLMARHTERPVKTFSIGFDEDSFNELKFARLAARHFATEHHEFVVTPREITSTVEELVWHFDEPFSDPSSLPTYAVSKLAREFVTVALSGDGGDELFAGYTRYVVDRHRSGFARLPRFVRRGLMGPLSRALPHGARGRNYLHNVALDPLDRYLDSVSTFTSLNKPLLYAEDFRRSLDVGGRGEDRALARFRAIAAGAPTADPLESLLYLDSKTYLPGDILVKVDRMSMAASLEARAPLLDHKLIEFVCRIPPSLKLSGTETKSIFKRAVRGLVPDELLKRPKQGFGMPIQQWINRELRDYIRDVLTGARARGRGYFRPAYVDLLLDEHARGRRDHSFQLWSLFVLELWQRNFVDRAHGGVATASQQTDKLRSRVAV